MERLLSLSKVKPVSDIDSVKQSMRRDERSRAMDVLFQAQLCWNGMAKFRRDRARNKRYNYGDQWQDLVTVDCKTMTEEEYIKEQGNVPLKNNLIRRLVRNVLGVYRSQNKVPVCFARSRDEQQYGEALSVLLKYDMQLNKMVELLSRTMEEFLISGFVVHRKWYGWSHDKQDCWTDNVQPNNFFLDSNMRDFRGWDASVVGEIHDVEFGKLCQKFAKSPSEYARLSEIYKYARDQRMVQNWYEDFGYYRDDDFDFMTVRDPNLCRVIEVWRKETKPRWRCHDYNTGEIYKIEIEDKPSMVDSVNADRVRRGTSAGMSPDDIPLIEAEWFVDEYWYCYMLSPFGDILDEYESPYEHKEHPYVFKAYPFIDGEIHSFVHDFVDQQRYTNRLVTLWDWIVRASAKGVLLVPEESIGSMDITEIADEWSRFNGVIAIKTKNGVPLPQQISNNSTNIGISELLNLQLKFFEDISGVNGALQGKPGYSGTSGSLYAQQTANATTSLLDVLDSFSSFVDDGAYKDLKNILQYYDDAKIKEIVGKELGVDIDPHRIREVEYDIRVSESTDTPTFRQMANDFLMQVWQSGQISIKQMLEVGDFPFADKLLQSLESQEAQMAQGQVPQGIPVDIRQEAQDVADMDAVEKAREMLRR